MHIVDQRPRESLVGERQNERTRRIVERECRCARHRAGHYKYIEALATACIENNWKEIEAVAAALIERGTLSSDRVRDAMLPHHMKKSELLTDA
jgi:hypothetical protein